ncbi:centrosome-associated zinc finger protein CP190 isoform X2 [Teleopsis dalmanni]|uniref:centrosome-associated zinc finger protein CP190 isoform X2 n=1 Tax=Teleopsis dalmanni TaxID=139649 RepID=UPI0018CD185F|nr:centrosome-associated zinc finger protein CP190 isoform X2 [Teleopsis dalmanni]
MGEIKSVKVDNWGVFFLQKLQNFFNKTDYCDLTLQFRDNSQLKVHRLVLSACTDYFNVLEQTCEVIDDALIMPLELQADVVVPIVNFMYTGTLEFELKMYGKLLRTAKEMNMTVLLKLLEAHRRTMEGVNRAQRPPSPKSIRRRGTPVNNQQIAAPPQKRVNANNTSTLQSRRVAQPRTIATSTPQAQNAQYRQQSGNATLLRTPTLSTSPTKIHIGHDIKREIEDDLSNPPQQPPSPFEQLRKGVSTKRASSVSFISPPAKKPNIEDVKEFAEQQRMRKQIAAEYAGDDEYEGMMDDDIHNDDDDDDAVNTTPSSTTAIKTQELPSYTFKTDNGDKIPTIVVKENSGNKLNTTKIISEVMRQFPHLAKSNKSIKLKIVTGPSGFQKVIIKKEQIDNIPDGDNPQQQQQKTQIIASQGNTKETKIIKQTPNNVVSQQKKDFGERTSTSAQTETTNSVSGMQKRRIDSKTMHALLALGAENTTGPWLCLRCGVSGRPISIPSYRGFRRHLINTHKESIDPALCEHCGWRSTHEKELHLHIQVEHNLNSSIYKFPECSMCAEIFIDTDALHQHMIENHNEENKQQCIYCNKIFAKELQLYTHMKTNHKKQALDDGIIDYSDEELVNILKDTEQESSQQLMESGSSKVKIISDISLPSAGTLLKLDSTTDVQKTLKNKPSIGSKLISTSENIATSVDHKFVASDGSELILTREQRKEILTQLNQEKNKNALIVKGQTGCKRGSISEGLNIVTIPVKDNTSPKAEIESIEDEYDDSEIYNEMRSQSVSSPATPLEDEVEIKRNSSNNLDESKESIENLEWAENLISEHELAEEVTDNKNNEKNNKSDDDISKKLKELTGDWSEDENDEEEIAAAESQSEFDNSTEKIVKIDVSASEKSCDDKLLSEKAVEKDSTAEVKSENDVKLEDDDIELAMKNLHSDDANESITSECVEEEKVVEENEDANDGNKFEVENDKEIKSEEKTDITEEVDSGENVLRSEDDIEPDFEKVDEFQNCSEKEIELGNDEADNEFTDSPIASGVQIIDELLTQATGAEKDDKHSEKVECEAANIKVEPSEAKSSIEEETATKTSSTDEKIKNIEKNKEKSEDNVKNLIKEWGEDEDGDGDGDGDGDSTKKL